MSTTIEWTQRPNTKGESWNPTTGCNKVSQGCKHCYAETMHRRLKAMGVKGYEHDFLEGARPQPHTLDRPLKWKNPRTVFVNSMSDLFHGAVPFSYIDQVFAVMALCPQHTFLILTKRPEWMADYLCDPRRRTAIEAAILEVMDANNLPTNYVPWVAEQLDALPNVWLGTSVENQAAADSRIPHLLRCPAAVRFLSCEPLLGPVDLSAYFGLSSPHELQQAEGRGDIPGRSGRPDRSEAGWQRVETGGNAGQQVEQTEENKASTTTPHRQVIERIPDGQNYDGRRSNNYRSTQAGVEDTCRTDTTRNDHKPQERRQGGQQTREPGVGDGPRAADSCNPCPECWQVRQSAGADEQHEQTHRRPSDGNPKEATNGRTANRHSQELRGGIPNYQQGVSNDKVAPSWIIAGGESGHGARPMHPDWARSLRDQCQVAGVPFFFKQWGAWIGGRFDRRKGKMMCQPNDPYDARMGRIFWTNETGAPKVHLWDEADHYWTNASAEVGKKAAGRLLDGVEHNEWPEPKALEP